MRKPLKVVVMPDIDFDVEIELAVAKAPASGRLHVRTRNVEMGLGAGWLTGFVVQPSGQEKLEGVTLTSAAISGTTLCIASRPEDVMALSCSNPQRRNPDDAPGTLTVSPDSASFVPALLFRLPEPHFATRWVDLVVDIGNASKIDQNVAFVAVFDIISPAGRRRIEEVGLRRHYKLPPYGISLHRELESAGHLEPATQTTRPMDGFNEISPSPTPDFIETIRVTFEEPLPPDFEEPIHMTVEIYVDGELAALVHIHDLLAGYRLLHPIFVRDDTHIAMEWPRGWIDWPFTVQFGGSRMKAPRMEPPTLDDLAAVWNPIRRQLLIQQKEPHVYPSSLL